jgi:hypothetical protein
MPSAVASKSTYLIAISMSVVAAGVWWLYGSNDGQPQIDVGNLSGRTQSNAVTNSQERQQDSQTEEAARSNVADRHVAGEARMDAASQIDPVPTALHSSEASQNPNPNSQVLASQLDGLSIPEGAAFPISQSIEAECARLEGKKIGCADARKLLKEFEEERTDNQWAPVMEKRLRAAYGQDPEIRIRALACRSSVCAVESEGSRVRLSIWYPLSDDLFPEDDIRAYEDVDGGGAILGVSLLVFTRER